MISDWTTMVIYMLSVLQYIVKVGYQNEGSISSTLSPCILEHVTLTHYFNGYILHHCFEGDYWEYIADSGV